MEEPSFASDMKSNDVTQVLAKLTAYLTDPQTPGVPLSLVEDLASAANPPEFVLNLVERLSPTCFTLPLQRRLFKGLAAALSDCLGKPEALNVFKGDTQSRRKRKLGKRDRMKLKEERLTAEQQNVLKEDKGNAGDAAAASVGAVVGEKRPREQVMDDKDIVPNKRPCNLADDTSQQAHSLRSRFLKLLETDTVSPFSVYLYEAYCPSDDLSVLSTLPQIIDRLSSIGATSDCAALIAKHSLFTLPQYDKILLTILKGEDVQSLMTILLNGDRRAAFLGLVDRECKQFLVEMESDLDAGEWSAGQPLLRTYSKHAARLAVRWGIDTTPFPHIVCGWRLGAISWLVGEAVEARLKARTTRDGGGTPWEGVDDLLLKAVRAGTGAAGESCLAKTVVRGFLKYGEGMMSAALEFAQELGLTNWLESVKDRIVAVPLPTVAANSGTTDLPLYSTSVPIEFVDTPEGLDRVRQLFAEDGKVAIVALDCEWTPEPLAIGDAETPAALLQMGIRTRLGEHKYLCFVLDLMNLDRDKLEEVLSSLLTNDEITKIGKFNFVFHRIHFEQKLND
ncbi:hypothetical protein HK104_000209 [Borealophlyctis nickersoniae]|nr:hypothetical protein HK104_000209 [Borealophlyctis nickersoniae]